MKILFLTLFLIGFSPFSPSHWNKNLILAQSDDPVFDDSDLADIEGSDIDDDFEAFEGEGEDYNFDEEDFEEIEEEDDEEEKDKSKKTSDKEIEESFEEIVGEFPEGLDEDDYEFIEEDDLEDDFDEDTDESAEEEFPEGLDEDNYEAIEERDDLEDDFDEDTDESTEEDDLEDESLDESIDEILGDLPEGVDEDDYEMIKDDEDMGDDSPDETLEDIDDQLQEEPIETGLEEPEEEIIPTPSDETMPIDTEDEPLGGIDEVVSEEALNLITNIRYLADKDQIVIDCSEPTSYQVKTNDETNQFIIEILQSKLGDNLHWPYVLRDFNTKFGLIKADQKDSSTVRIIVQLKEGADFPKSILTENSDQILIGYGEVKGFKIVKPGTDTSEPGPILPPRTLQDLYSGNIKFSGEPISIHVIDAPVKQVLRFVSEESGLNMVIGESVQGTVTLKLEDVPWDQALYTIFKVKSLGYTRDGNVITVLPLTEIETRTKKLRSIADKQRTLAPYQTKVIPISYTKITDIESKVKSFLTSKSDLVKGGEIITHQESNTFVVIDTPEVIEKIESLVKYLDKPPKQVMVSAKIVEVAKNFTKNIGLNWRLNGNLSLNIGANGFLDFFQGIGKTLNFGVSNTGAGSATLTLNGLPFVGNLNSTLSLAETEGHVKVISSPKLVVISGKSAEMTRNAPILIPAQATSGATGTVDAQNVAQGGQGVGGVPFNTQGIISYQQVNVEISLKVTPTVTTAGSVFLQINVTRTDPGSGAGDQQAVTIQKTAKTEILTKNGETIVIGGLYEQVRKESNDGVPLLKHIPFLGRLFSKQTTTQSDSELLVFITPKLLDSHE